MSKKWYTSDFHFFHHNIIRYCDRPFADVDQMHRTIIDNMNSRVQKNDELFILGDVSFYGGEKTRDLLKQINGRKHFIIGNHDAKNLKNWSGWASANHYLEVKDKGQKIVLMHYPIESWNKMAHGAIHLHGHRHGVNTRYEGMPSKNFREDIGVDPWDFFPVSLDDLTNKWLKEGKLV